MLIVQELKLSTSFCNERKSASFIHKTNMDSHAAGDAVGSIPNGIAHVSTKCRIVMLLVICEIYTRLYLRFDC